jgi:hypothetical protein
MRADVYCYNSVALSIEYDSEIRLDFGGVNDPTIASGKFLDFVGAQARIERVLLKNGKRVACAPLLLGRQLREAAPERASRAEMVFHLSPGYGSLSAVSRSTNRPASASAIPCLNDSGIQESSFSTTNLATCARSLAGRALNCLISSVALMMNKVIYQLTRRKSDLILRALVHPSQAVYEHE